MWQAIRSFKKANLQTKFFILNFFIYFLVIVWTTFQAYARLEYSRSDIQGPIFIQTQPADQSPP